MASALAVGQASGQADIGQIKPGLRERLSAVETARGEAAERWQRERREAKTDEAREAARTRYEGQVRREVADLLDLTESHPDDPDAVRALEFVIMTDYQGSLGLADRAIGLLTRQHVRRRPMGNYCEVLTNLCYSPPAEAFIRAVLERHPDREARALACHSLATLLRNQAEFARHLRAHPDQIKAYQSEHGAEAIDRFLREKDPGSVEKGAEAALERVVAEFAEVRHAPNDPRTLGDVASGELNEMRHLNVGQAAPEIEGAAIDGRRFKLSDFRGKVVMLVFSGEWCRPCVEMYPRERALQARYKDKPFAIVSVNTDQDRETLRKSIDAGKVTWPCWWDGGTDGPITTHWGVSGHPTVYVLDRLGVIRFKGLHGEAIDQAVASLMGQADQKTL